MIELTRNDYIVSNNSIYFIVNNRLAIAYSFKKYSNNNVTVYSYQLIK